MLQVALHVYGHLHLSLSAPGPGHPAFQPQLWNSEVQTWENLAIPGRDAQSWKEPLLSSLD